MARRDKEMIPGIGVRFNMGYRRLAYDMVLKELPLFYKLGNALRCGKQPEIGPCSAVWRL
jgi:hypothetical protein